MSICTSIEFNIIKEIGAEGANSKVYLAHDIQLNSDLVVKRVLKTQFKDEDGNVNPDAFFNESRILYNTQHPNIMEIQYASEDKDAIYLSMPFCKNGSLNALIKKRFLTVREIIKYSLDFLSGLHYIHTKGLIHFDVKPTNILINNNGRAVMADFGLAKYVNEYGLASPDLFYRCHMPPETADYSLHTAKFDIYQAGVTLYRMCNGNAFFKSQFDSWFSKGKLEYAIKSEKFPDRSNYLPHIPNKLRRIIKKAMSSNPEDRYATILDMINQLSRVDENLDWEYNEDRNKCSFAWSKENERHTQIETISLKNDGSQWNIDGIKTNKDTGKSKKVTKWCSDGYTNIESALKVINKLINEK